MEIKDLAKKQKEFDAKHGWKWDVDDEEGMLERLKYLAVAINGEAGEFANMVKKAMREKFPEGKIPDESQMKEIRKELVDIFIYTIIASNALRMDLEKEWEEKMKGLEQRFRKFEK